jgi:hypothetical protein
MAVLDMMRDDVDSIVGKTVEYDFGGSNPLVMNVTHTKKTPWNWTDDDGFEQTSYTYSISENDTSYYTVCSVNTTIILE